jgi:deazaflavin-dependent oxidoreductase (nitroreductase family)
MDKITRIVSNIHARLIRATGRLGSGSGDGAVLVLTHTGARSGKVRQNPLMFFNHEGGYVVVASKGGMPENPAWYHNLKAQPEVTVLVSGKEIPVTAHPIESGPERDVLYARMVELNPGFGAYEEKTERTIPVVKLVPRTS